MRISDWSSDVCSSDLPRRHRSRPRRRGRERAGLPHRPAARLTPQPPTTRSPRKRAFSLEHAMTVSANYAPLEYAGNGVTVNFPVTWPFDAAASLLVTEVDDATGASVLKALTTHYLVTQTRTGGTVTALTPPVTGTTWRISRTTPKTQPNQLRL